MKTQYSFPFINKDIELTRKHFNKNYIVRLYPNSNDTHNNRLIGYDRFMSCFEGSETLRIRVFKKMINLTKDKLDLKLRRGIRITIILK